MYRCGGEALTNLTPSNSTPASITSGKKYKATAGGYAISSYTSKTPDDSSPPEVSSGDIVKITTNGGYLYKTLAAGFPYKKSGTLSDFTAANQEQSVNTGLTSINYVYVEGWANNGAVLQSAWLDKDKSGAKQIAVYTTVTGTSATALSSGTNSDGLLTGNSAAIKVSGISGGTLTIKTGNAATYISKNVKWYAG